MSVTSNWKDVKSPNTRSLAETFDANIAKIGEVDHPGTTVTRSMSPDHQQQLKNLILNMLKPMGSREQPSQVLTKVEELMRNVGCTTSEAKADLQQWGVYRYYVKEKGQYCWMQDKEHASDCQWCYNERSKGFCENPS